MFAGWSAGLRPQRGGRRALQLSKLGGLAAPNSTALKPAYTRSVSCREAEVDNSQSAQEMWFECDAEEVRENGRRCFEENKETRKVQANMLWFACTSIGNGN